MMTNGETQNVYVLLRYMLGAIHNGNAVPEEDTARQAAMNLADRARQASHGGITPEEVELLWIERRPQPAGSPAAS